MFLSVDVALADGLAWGWLDCYVLGVFVLAWWGQVPMMRVVSSSIRPSAFMNSRSASTSSPSPEVA